MQEDEFCGHVVFIGKKKEMRRRFCWGKLQGVGTY
jgi:hypothetical protein